MHGSPLQQLHGSQVGKLDCFDFSAAELQVDRAASQLIQQQSSSTTNMPRFGLSWSCRLFVYPWGKCVACSHSGSQTLSGSCCIQLAQAAKSFTRAYSMRKTLWEILCDENRTDVKQNGNRLRTLGAAVEISCPPRQRPPQWGVVAVAGEVPDDKNRRYSTR